MLWEMPSRSDRSSARFLVPRTFRSVVWASRRVDKSALATLATEEMGSLTRKYTTPSTLTVTESLVRICDTRAIVQRFMVGGKTGSGIFYAGNVECCSSPLEPQMQIQFSSQAQFYI